MIVRILNSHLKVSTVSSGLNVIDFAPRISLGYMAHPTLRMGDFPYGVNPIRGALWKQREFPPTGGRRGRKTQKSERFKVSEARTIHSRLANEGPCIKECGWPLVAESSLQLRVSKKRGPSVLQLQGPRLWQQKWAWKWIYS